jgi:RCC1 repeats protein (beta propeller fold)
MFFQNGYSLQLGNGNEENQYYPIKIMDGVMQVSCNMDYSMIIKKDNSLWGTGSNDDRVFGNGNIKTTHEFIYLEDNVKTVSAGVDCAAIIKPDNTLWISGCYPTDFEIKNGYKRLKFEFTDKFIKIDSDVKKVFVGFLNILYIKNDNSLWCIGDNAFGELGLGDRTGTYKPEKIAENVLDCFANDNFSFYINNKHELFLTGDKTYFALEKGKEIRSRTFIKVLDDVKQVSEGYILKTNGDVFVYGYSCYGALGIENTKETLQPLTYLMSNVKKVDSNQFHTLILNDKNELFACGGGWCNYGCNGNGSSKIQKTPVKIMENVKDFSTGYYHSMVIKNDDSLWAFGLNNMKESALGL